LHPTGKKHWTQRKRKSTNHLVPYFKNEQYFHDVLHSNKIGIAISNTNRYRQSNNNNVVTFITFFIELDRIIIIRNENENKNKAALIIFQPH